MVTTYEPVKVGDKEVMAFVPVVSEQFDDKAAANRWVDQNPSKVHDKDVTVISVRDEYKLTTQTVTKLTRKRS